MDLAQLGDEQFVADGPCTVGLMLPARYPREVKNPTIADRIVWESSSSPS